MVVVGGGECGGGIDGGDGDRGGSVGGSSVGGVDSSLTENHTARCDSWRFSPAPLPSRVVRPAIAARL